MRRTLIASAFVLAVLGVWGCGNSSPAGPTGSGTLTVMLKDSPFSDARALLVTFSDVSAHRSGGDFVSLPFAGASTRTCDLKRLTGAQDVLGTGSLAAGHYTELRLTVVSAVIYFDNVSTGAACAPSIAAPAGGSAAVNIPSGTIRLNREFDVTANQATTIVVDFDGNQSVTQTGAGIYQMAPPVLAIVSVQ